MMRDATYSGLSFKEMVEICKDYKFEAEAYKVSSDDYKGLCMDNFNCPSIIQWNNGSHFVILEKIKKKHIIIVDPAIGKLIISKKEFQDKFTGYILVVRKNDKINFEIKQKKEKSDFNFNEIMKENNTLFSFVMIISLFLLLIGVIPTYILGKLIDQLINYNTISLRIFKLVFILPVFLFILNFIREQSVIILTNKLEFRMTTKIFRHLLELPLSFFENRNKGDLINRYYMIGQIREIFSEHIISLTLNAIIFIFYMCVLFYYSIQMGLVILILACVIGILLILLANISFAFSKKTLLSQIDVQNIITECVNNIQDIKSYTLESSFFLKWKKIFLRYIIVRQSNGTLASAITALLSALQIFQSFLIFIIGSKYVEYNYISFGDLFYVLSLATVATEPIFSSCTAYLTLIRISASFQRINDITEHKTESSQTICNNTNIT